MKVIGSFPLHEFIFWIDNFSVVDPTLLRKRERDACANRDGPPKWGDKMERPPERGEPSLRQILRRLPTGYCEPRLRCSVTSRRSAHPKDYRMSGVLRYTASDIRRFLLGGRVQQLHARLSSAESRSHSRTSWWEAFGVFRSRWGIRRLGSRPVSSRGRGRPYTAYISDH